jgi:hypothetical protein
MQAAGGQKVRAVRCTIAAMVVACLSLACASCSSAKAQTLSGDYQRRANGVCSGWTTALKQLGNSPPLADVNRVTSFTEKQLTIDRSYTAQFKALSATPAELTALGPVYMGFDMIIAAEEGTLSSAQSGDRIGVQTYHQRATNATTTLNVTLKSLGLNVCAAS